MNSFKLIAIVPLRDNDGEFSKNLKTGKPYYFYKGYTISVVDDRVKSISVDPEEQPEINLYTLQNEIDVSISAVVGENGSGKSTLFELLYYMIYVLATGGTKKDGPLENIVNDLHKQIVDLNNEGYWLKQIHQVEDPVQVWEQPENLVRLDEKLHIKGALLAHLIKKHEISLDLTKVATKEDVAAEVLRQLANKRGTLELRFRRAIEKDIHIIEFLDVSLLYEKEGIIYELNCGGGEISHYRFVSEKDKEPVEIKFENLFYTISLNYSHHSLNSGVLGEWITKLFHKNDAYTTPLVISPMRTNGNYDINKELRLSRERLMNTLVYDLLRKKEYSLLGKYKLKNFIFKNKRNELLLPFDQESFDELRSSGLLRASGIQSFKDNMPLAGFALAYLEEKIERMAETYDGLIDYTTSGKQPQDVQVDFVNGENTHATKKIRQTLNYLKAVQRNGGRAVFPELNQAGEIIISPEELEHYILSFPDYNKNAGPVRLMDYAMPGFVSVDFEFSAPSGKSIRLSQLSSGEQQMVFNINTILYHLYNLQSVHVGVSSKSKGSAVADRKAYEQINIVLDEVELYYHPEMQRQLIENLISALERLESPKTFGISSINICILTHSPFILSDIPIQNTLRMGSASNSEENQTFAANIHELLRNDFFLKESFMGAFAQRRINEVIDSLQVAVLLNEHPSVDESTFLRYPGYNPKTKTATLSQQTCRGIIELVGEPVLRISLMELYSRAYRTLFKDSITGPDGLNTPEA